jgi:citrate lyase subunit beta/citryl-CoA lyase
MEKIGLAGNYASGVKSDCLVQFESTKSGGLQIEINSRVKSMFGISMENLAKDILYYFEIENAKLKIDDTGAVDFVLAARIEAAIKKVITSNKEFLLPILEENKIPTQKDDFRFSRLYLPGNTPKLMLNAGIHKPNGLILDLEDAVAPEKKYEAKFVVRNALRALNFYGSERMVRINQIPGGLDDLEYIVPHFVNLILIPKCESAKDILSVNQRIDMIKQREKLSHDIWLMPIIESAKGVMNAYEIVTAADNISSMAIGLEDYTADIGTLRTKSGTESLFARNMIVTASIAAGVQPIDSVFSDVGDMDGLAENVKVSKNLGFSGMGCIHPRQIRVIHENFSPETAEIEKAKKIVIAFNDAKKKGLGVVSMGSKMIDAPVVKRALNTITTAILTGKLEADWMDN